jgi:hypothetical protein
LDNYSRPIWDRDHPDADPVYWVQFRKDDGSLWGKHVQSPLLVENVGEQLLALLTPEKIAQAVSLDKKA